MANMQNMLGMTPEQMEIARRYRMADVLRKQAEEPDQGQMVSGHYVAPSWTQNLSKLLSAYGAGKMEREADAATKRYGEQQKADFSETAQKYAQALRGVPADKAYDPELGQEIDALPAQPGSAQDALMVAMQSKSPAWQQFAMKGMLEQAKKTPRDQFGAIMPHFYTPESLAAFQRSGNYGDLAPTQNSNFGKYNPGQYTPESWASFVQTGNPADLRARFAPMQIDQGDVKTILEPGSGKTREFDVRLSPEQTPSTKGAQAAAVETAKAAVEQTTKVDDAARKAASELPVIEDKASYAINLLDQMVGSEDGKIEPHKGFDNYIGTLTGEYQAKIPSSQAADFKTYHDQVKGRAFLEAFESLKGGGQITQVEGDKATSAITRMERAQSRVEYTKAARELQAIIRQGLKRARDKAKTQQPNARPSLDSLWD